MHYSPIWRINLGISDFFLFFITISPPDGGAQTRALDDDAPVGVGTTWNDFFFANRFPPMRQVGPEWNGRAAFAFKRARGLNVQP